MGRVFIAALVVVLGLLAAWYSVFQINPNALTPKVTTQPSRHDTDDPVKWVNKENPERSLILGTDKDEDGALYVYDLNGKIIEDKVVRGLKWPNNVDVEGFVFDNGDEIHIAVITERLTNKLRIFSVPAMTPVDNGGIEVFVGEQERDPMGIALYKRQSDDAVFAIVSRNTGPSDGYLWQCRLTGNPDGTISGQKIADFVRKKHPRA
jgi:myo-inositol-hexaphosphate 3-phosphohydrolase